MYLSKLIVNQDNRTGAWMFSDAYETHKTIWRGLPDSNNGGPGRVLFRTELMDKGRSLVILVQSDVRPNWQPLLEDGVFRDAQCKEVRINSHNGQLLRFRIRANPTAKRIVDETKRDEDGRPKRARVGLFGDEKQLGWLNRKAQENGFHIVDCEIKDKQNVDSAKKRNTKTIRHLGVTFDGILEVTDPQTFSQALENGIGSAKGFGFGLLSIAPIRR